MNEHLEKPAVEPIIHPPASDGNLIPVQLTINGKNYQLNLEAWTSILDTLREHLDLQEQKKDATMVSAERARC